MPTVRPATTDDIASIQRVARTTWHATYDEILGSESVDQQVDEWYDESFLQDAITDDDAVYLVATDDGTVVGYASGGPAAENDPDCASLHAIYVRPDNWNDGLGSRLFGTVTDWLRERGFERLRIQVLSENERARAFYEQQGYTTSDRQEVELAGTRVIEVVYDGPL